MKTLMKKLFVLFFITVLVISALPLFASASNAQNEYDYEIGDTHYTVIFNDELAEEQKEYIAKNILGIDDGFVNPCGLMCTLFGHDNEVSYPQIITHKTRATAPRCTLSYYQAKSCTRCGNLEYTLLSESYIDCCPVG